MIFKLNLKFKEKNKINNKYHENEKFWTSLFINTTAANSRIKGRRQLPERESVGSIPGRAILRHKMSTQCHSANA